MSSSGCGRSCPHARRSWSSHRGSSSDRPACATVRARCSDRFGTSCRGRCLGIGGCTCLGGHQHPRCAEVHRRRHSPVPCRSRRPCRQDRCAAGSSRSGQVLTGRENVPGWPGRTPVRPTSRRGRPPDPGSTSLMPPSDRAVVRRDATTSGHRDESGRRPCRDPTRRTDHRPGPAGTASLMGTPCAASPAPARPSCRSPSAGRGQEARRPHRRPPPGADLSLTGRLIRLVAEHRHDDHGGADAHRFLFVHVLAGAIDARADGYVDYLLLVTVASGTVYTAFRVLTDLQGGLFCRPSGPASRC